jgi:hypothetical protein
MNVFKSYFVCSVTEYRAKTCARHAGTDRVIGYSVRFSSVHPGKCRCNASDYAMTASFNPFKLLYIHNHTIQALLLTASLDNYKHITNADAAQQRVKGENGHEG